MNKIKINDKIFEEASLATEQADQIHEKSVRCFGRGGLRWYTGEFLNNYLQKIELLNHMMPAQTMRLHMGEMTAQEVRTARAAIYWANSKIMGVEE